jgi:Cu-Zn family superoxide dismutase
MGVGVHWNIYNMNHGCPPNATRHLGDTGNWDVQLDGTLVQVKELDMITLKGVNSLVGLGCIFHNKTDDCNDPLSSGQRLAQGVIGVGKPPNVNTDQNTALPPTAYGGGYSLTSAMCILQRADATYPNITGWVRFDQATPTSVTTVTSMIYGLLNGTRHGFHVHQYGDLSLADSTSAGGHYTGPVYNLTSTHSIPTSGLPAHVGDMGNIYYYDVNSVAYYQNTFTDFGLYGSTNNIIGRAVIVHALADDCGQPYGNAGQRSSICVIGPANPAYLAQHVFPIGTVVPVAQDVFACPLITTGDMTTGFASAAFLVPSILTTLFAFLMAYF